MKPSIRALVDWASQYDWALQPGKDGNGHWVLRHPGGGIVRLPDTPGEHRGLANARAEIRRKAGLPSDSGPAAKYRHEPHEERFSMEAALREKRLRDAWREVEIRRRLRNTTE
jgi:hypothetical protein